MDSLEDKINGLMVDSEEEQAIKPEEPLKPNLNFADIANLMDHLNMITSESQQNPENEEQDKVPTLLCPIPENFDWDEAAKDGEPVVPNFEIDFNNPFDDVTKLVQVEKQLELLYKPFICVMEVSCRFNMYELCIMMPESRYDPGSHPSVAIKVRNPSAHVRIYAGGKMVASALTSASARNALFKVVRVVQELDYKADIKNFNRNIVNASFMMPFKIDLHGLILLYADKVTHNNSTRPFITYTLDDSGVRFAIFPTGFVLALHSSARSETQAAIASILPILAKFKNGYPTLAEKKGEMMGDVSYKLVWEHKLEMDNAGLLLYS